MGLLIILALALLAALTVGRGSATHPEIVYVPVEPAQPCRSGCMPLLAVALVALVLIALAR